MKNISTKVKIAGFILIVVILSIVLILINRSKQKPVVTIPLTVTKSIPVQNAINVNVFDPIVFTFNQGVDAKNFNVSSEPSEDWSITQATSSSINLNHKQYLLVSKKYTVSVFYNGESVTKLNFETEHNQNDPRLLQELQSELDRDYPLASLTPYETAEFKVVYSAPLTFEITLKGPTSPDNAILQVKAWVGANGGNPANHKYTIAGSYPTPTP